MADWRPWQNPDKTPRLERTWVAFERTADSLKFLKILKVELNLKKLETYRSLGDSRVAPKAGALQDCATA
jgi:hypothetical protein